MCDSERPENETPKNGNKGNTKRAAYIAFVPALIVTGLIVTPLGLLFDHLELTGKFKLPNWVIMPAVFGIIALFRVICIILTGIIEKHISKK